ncbi:MAG: OmpA family protein [Cytophagaceae bacterium]|nr:OmpA family protein [Cytophagaceae bacterium]MDW8456547.1 OmpA family protein [Cytophagaceae bacterium]
MKRFFILVAFGQAICAFTNTLYAQKHSKLARTYALMAQASYDSADFTRALEYYKKAEQVHPGDVHFLYSIALCNFNLGYYEEAKNFFEKIQASKIKDPKRSFYMGRTYHALYKHDEAIAEYNRYLKTNPKLPAKEKNKIELLIQQCNNGKKLLAYPVKVKISNVGNLINTQYPEYNPAISADETMLIFTSRRKYPGLHGIDPRDNKPYEEIYISVRSDRQHNWTTPVPFSNLINTTSHEACIALSADAQHMYIYKPDNGGDIFVSDLLGTIWSEPTPLGNNINSPYWEPCASISADGKVLFFVSDRPGGKGGTDIYMSKRLASGNFGPPILLSDKINTPYDEFSPYIHPDGKTLYFSSTGHNSMGGYDIFFCTINTETGEILSAPQNVGYPINTSDDDVYFVWSADNKRAYFASMREGGQGEKDIYMLEKEESENATLIIYKGKVTDCATHLPLLTTVTITDNATQEILSTTSSNATTGKFISVLVDEKNFGIGIDAPGYEFFSKNIILKKGEEFREIEDSFCLEKIFPGTKMTLHNIFFENQSAALHQSSKAELMRLYNMLNENPEIKILIAVHSDSSGDEQVNLKLTEERASAIRDYLVEAGINSKRIFYKGYGESKPLFPNGTWVQQMLNRRVEIEILK